MNEIHVFAAIEQAQMALARYKESVPGTGKEVGRSLALVATKLDEARLWLSEAVEQIERADQGDAL